MPRFQIPEKLVRVMNTKSRIIVLIGGRASGKTEFAGRWVMMKGQTEQADVLCGREFQTSIDDSVHKLLVGLIEKLGIQGVTWTEKKIDFKGGGSTRYKGFARNPAAIKSAQDFKYSWIEEAQDMSEKSIDDLILTIRATGSQLLFTANPQASTDPFSVRFIAPFQKALDTWGFYEDDMHLIIMVNWRDNPWHGELEANRLFDLEHMTRAKYDHIWEGAYNDTVEDAIIMAEWFDAAIDAHIKLGFKPVGARVVSHDPSDKGPDPKGLCLRHGSVILDVQEKQGLDINDGCDWATGYAIEHDADFFTWDCDGMGVGLRRQVSEAFEGKHIDWDMFKGSEGVENPDAIYEPLPGIDGIDRRKARTNKETIKNKRSQYCRRLADRFYKTYRAVEHGEYTDPDELISISSKIENLTKLRSETCRIPRKTNNSGLFQVMTKVEMQTKHQIASPNMFDALFMSLKTPPVAVLPSHKPVSVPNLRRARL